MMLAENEDACCLRGDFGVQLPLDPQMNGQWFVCANKSGSLM